MQAPDSSQEEEMKISSEQEKSTVSASAEGQMTEDENKVIAV